jgi:hypothetical protein
MSSRRWTRRRIPAKENLELAAEDMYKALLLVMDALGGDEPDQYEKQSLAREASMEAIAKAEGKKCP